MRKKWKQQNKETIVIALQWTGVQHRGNLLPRRFHNSHNNNNNNNNKRRTTYLIIYFCDKSLGFECLTMMVVGCVFFCLPRIFMMAVPLLLASSIGASLGGMARLKSLEWAQRAFNHSTERE